ncbi:MAG: hypothetical protein AAFN74_02205 [Myxococcota bacterium]
MNRHNAQGAQVSAIAVTHAGSQTLTVTVDGVVVEVPTASSDETSRDALLAALQGNSFLAGRFLFESSGVASIQVRKTEDGTFSITGSGTAGADAAVTLTSSGGDAFNAGVILLEDLASKGGVVLPRGAGGTIAGLAAHRNNEQDFRLPAAQRYDYMPGNQVLVGYQGAYIVVVEEAVTRASTPHYRHTASANGFTLGAIRASTDGGNAAPLPGFRFLADADAGGKVPMQVNLP